MELDKIIDTIWNNTHSYGDSEIKDILNTIIYGIETNQYSIVYKSGDTWLVSEYIKKAILLYFKYNDMEIINSNPFIWHDKISIRNNIFNTRLVPGAIVRNGVYIGNNVVIMPSFINIGAHIGDNTMVDSFVTVGSCAYIGSMCHVGAGTSIGGVLEPIQAHPVIIEDNCFIGAGCNILEGMIIKANTVIAPGVTLSGSTKIIDRETQEIHYSYIPSNSLVVPGSINVKDGLSMYCAVIAKKIDYNTKKKISINDILREY